jgi:hypothetical protein
LVYKKIIYIFILIKVTLDKKFRWIIAGSIIAIIAGIIIWQIYSYIILQNSIILSDPVEGSETIIQTSPGEPLKKATQDVKENISNLL